MIAEARDSVVTDRERLRVALLEFRRFLTAVPPGAVGDVPRLLERLIACWARAGRKRLAWYGGVQATSVRGAYLESSIHARSDHGEPGGEARAARGCGSGRRRDWTR